MKNPRLFLLSAFLLYCTVFFDSCTKQEGLTIDQGKICFTGVGGAAQCAQMDANNYVLMSKNGTEISLTQREAKGLFSARVKAELTELGTLQSMLEANRQVVTFDPAKVGISWKGDTIYLTELATLHVQYAIPAAASVHALLFYGRGTSEASLAIYGGGECKVAVDLVGKLNEICTDEDNVCSLNLHVCGTRLLGSFTDLDGGLPIIVVDPAVIDPDWLGFVRESFDPGLNVKGMRMPTIFQTMPASKLSPLGAAKPLPTIFKMVSGSVPPVSDDCTWDANVQMDTLCRFRADVEIMECGGIMTVRELPDGEPHVFDLHHCDFTLRRDRSTHTTYILCAATCSSLFAAARCE
jgi:hypothetical protein